jgi:streptogramin lyase
LTSRARRSGVALLALTALAAATLAAYWPASAPAAPLGEVHEIPLPSGVNAESIAAGPEGDMWFTEVPSTAIGRVTPGGAITEFPGLKSEAYEIALGPEGDLWFTEPGARTIGRITAAGAITEFSEGLNEHPFGIARGPEGNMWFTTPHSVGRITPAGQITEFKKGLFGNPGSITAGADGNLWFTVESTEEPAIGRVTPAGAITEFPIEHTWINPIEITQAADGAVAFTASGENPGEEFEYLIGLVEPSGAMYFTDLEAVPAGIATGPEGDLWFAGEGDEPGKSSAIGRVAGDVKPEELPDEHAHDFTSGLAEELEPEAIAPGPEGSMWLTNRGRSPAIRWIGTGAPAAAKESPLVSGPGEVGGTLTCENAVWNNWAAQQPSLSAFGFDGYTWLLEGSPIPGQTSQSFSPTAADAGHSVSCSIRATYPLLSVTVSATSPTVKVIGPAPPAVVPISAPAVSALTLPHQTDTVSSHGTLHVTVDCAGAPCSGTVQLLSNVKLTTGKGKHRHKRTVTVTIAIGSFTALALGADQVSLKLTSGGLSLLKSDGYKLIAATSIDYVTTGSTHATTTASIQLKGTKPKPKKSRHNKS